MTRSWVEISLERLRHNAGVIQCLLPPGCQIMAVVKSDAYGHGMIPVAGVLKAAGVRRFAVACVEEGVRLREALPEVEILVLGGAAESDAPVLRAHDLTVSVFDHQPLSPDVKIHLKIDTGMNRLGIDWKRAAQTIERLRANLTGVYSHLACAEDDPEFSRRQIERFLKASRTARVFRHLCGSAGLQYAEGHLDGVRPGLALYGIASIAGLKELKPVLAWKARILSIKEVAKGERVGYGGTFQTRRKTRLGVLAAGYADGYNRHFSNRGQVRVRDRLVPVIGVVSMDLAAVDLTELPDVAAGEVATLLEADPQSPISAAALAQQLNTIPYEVFTSIGPRVKRVYAVPRPPFT